VHFFDHPAARILNFNHLLTTSAQTTAKGAPNPDYRPYLHGDSGRGVRFLDPVILRLRSIPTIHPYCLKATMPLTILELIYHFHVYLRTIKSSKMLATLNHDCWIFCLHSTSFILPESQYINSCRIDPES
jgi:hypothetical protein